MMSAFFLFLCAFLLEIPTAQFSRQNGKREAASISEFGELAWNVSSAGYVDSDVSPSANNFIRLIWRAEVKTIEG